MMLFFSRSTNRCYRFRFRVPSSYTAMTKSPMISRPQLTRPRYTGLSG